MVLYTLISEKILTLTLDLWPRVNIERDMLVKFHKSTLENGLRVVTEEIEGFPTLSLGFWFNVGSRDEAQNVAGITHFIEHMLFKGTKNRGALEIAKEMDRLGGYANAFTSKEQTCFYAKVLPEDLPRLLDLLTDLLLNPLFGEEDIEREKQVVLQEIKMVEDSPEELVHELFSAFLWNSSPLGRPILGTWETVSRLDRARILAHFERFYGPPNLVVAAVGRAKHEELLEILEKYGSSFRKAEPPLRQALRPQSGVKVYRRSLEQVHFVLGVSTPGARDEARYAALLFNTLLGGNMSSRLFQEIREKRGLAYAVYSFLSLYEDRGCLGVYAAVEKKNLKETLKIMADEIKALMEGEFRPDELTAALDHLKSAILLSSDSPDHRMSRLARNELLFSRYIPYEESINAIKALTPAQVASLAREIFTPLPALAVLGPVAEDELLFFDELFGD